VRSFAAAAFGTNCYVVAPGEGEECVVVDPGIGVLDRLQQVLTEGRLRPAAVLLTHGHVDHVYSVTPVCGAPALVHGADRYRLADPFATLDPALVAMLEQQFGRSATWDEPDDVRPLVHGEPRDIQGLAVRVVHAPGHTEGSVMFALDGSPEAVRDSGPGSASGFSATVLSGDVLFQGSIGRTDRCAPRLASLRDRVLTLADDTLVLPGHGPATTIAQERATNPYLAEAAQSQAAQSKAGQSQATQTKAVQTKAVQTKAEQS
jgi:glyoxylase-like metal-dependent hydrolase (beta-lactamase superfamily II)